MPPLQSWRRARARQRPRRRSRWLAPSAVLLAVVAALTATVAARSSGQRDRRALTGATPGDALLVAGNRSYDLELAATQAQQDLGLGNRAQLPEGAGMLFVYHSSEVRCFWMKDMRFALDIIWLSDLGRVVSVQRDVLPKSFPSAYCAESQDVVELGAGQAQAAGIEVGQVLRVEMPASAR